ncbi:flavodoxin [Anaeromicrobium sediminis]|uniref:Flavodoxin n=1 Tax=Anaeromicrobium sediminis TaxID=1478221 RepID=A0A267MIF7_9FIRM|nr:flavodoxin [Anaeromicrobium sediminis]PAB58718.1 flavodoxin [Anaeromicrobium sediminis]
MKKAVIIYWSGTGNTEAMAQSISEGVKNKGVEVDLVTVDNADVSMVENADFVALGCPSMGAEVLEEYSMEPFVESLKDVSFGGKKLALFGSYDWGDGQWMRDWEERMSDYGADIVGDGLMVHLTPDSDGEQQCKELGEKLVG